MKQVTINYLTYSIVEVETRSQYLIINGNQCYGSCHYATQTIYIDETLSIEKKRSVLKHELTHAFISIYLLKQVDRYSEEELCEFVAIYGTEIVNIANTIYPLNDKENK